MALRDHFLINQPLKACGHLYLYNIYICIICAKVKKKDRKSESDQKSRGQIE